MGLATIQRIAKIEAHSNADRLEIASVLGYECIIPKGKHAAGDLVVFIEPDAVLPVAPWTESVYGYTSKGRVKAARLRGVWSMGLVMALEILPPARFVSVGEDVSSLLGVVKYEPPLPKDLKSKGYLPFGIPKTDEERWQNIPDELMPWDQEVEVTLKIDGSSFTAYCVLPGAIPGCSELQRGVCSRSLDLRLEGDFTNPWLEVTRGSGVLDSLEEFCIQRGVSLALRGEVYGQGIQGLAVNPHCREPLAVAFYSVWNIAERRYEAPDSELGYRQVSAQLGLAAVPLIERAPLTKSLLHHYGDELEEVNGQPLEGVVLKAPGFSCKVMNKFYDSKK